MSDISDAIDPDEERLVETGAPAPTDVVPDEDLPVEVVEEDLQVPDADRPADPVADDDLV
jgi:hypothetical protein